MGNPAQAKSDMIAHAVIQLVAVRDIEQNHALTILSIPNS